MLVAALDVPVESKLCGEFFLLHLNARREGDQLVSVASFRMAGRRREYQVEVRLPVDGSWFNDALQVDLPASWGNTDTRCKFLEGLTWFVRAVGNRLAKDVLRSKL